MSHRRTTTKKLRRELKTIKTTKIYSFLSVVFFDFLLLPFSFTKKSRSYATKLISDQWPNFFIYTNLLLLNYLTRIYEYCISYEFCVTVAVRSIAQTMTFSDFLFLFSDLLFFDTFSRVYTKMTEFWEYYTFFIYCNAMELVLKINKDVQEVFSCRCYPLLTHDIIIIITVAMV